jgi:hypothetical protein
MVKKVFQMIAFLLIQFRGLRELDGHDVSDV